VIGARFRYRAPLKTLITARRLNFSHLRLAKTLTARQALRPAAN